MGRLNNTITSLIKSSLLVSIFICQLVNAQTVELENDSANLRGDDWQSSTTLGGYSGDDYLIHGPKLADVGILGTPIDNTEASKVGSWKTKNKRKGFYGENYLQIENGDGDAVVTWPSKVANSGMYDVYAIWPAHKKHSDSATYTINHVDGSDGVSVNQKTGGLEWHLLGTYPLDENSSVSLSNDATLGNVMADAISILPAGTEPEVIYAKVSSATWKPALEGEYQVFAQWPADDNNASNTLFTIFHAEGREKHRVDQRSNGGEWNLLGTYTLDIDSRVRIKISGDGNVVVDGMRFVPVAASEGGTYYYHNDHLGTPQVMTDSNATVVWQANYTPFGAAELVVETVTNNIRFPGQYYDEESGLHYNYFRDYDPELGRYIQSDPIGLAGGINTYGYVGGNPVNAIDPLGLDTVFIWKPGTYTDSSGNSYPSSYGHTSSMSDYGTYLSHHPDKKGLNPAESLFRTYMQDKALYGRDADLIMYVDNPNKLASDKFAKDYLSSEDYWGVFGNCTDATRSTLNAGESAIRNLNVGSDNLVSYPSELERALRGSYWLNRRIIRDVNPFNP